MSAPSASRARLRCLAAVMLVGALAGCAGEDAEVVALQQELEEQRQVDATVAERLEALEGELETTARHLDRLATASELDRVSTDLEALGGTLEQLEGQVSDLLGSVDELRVAAENGAAARQELDARVGTLADELERTSGQLRGSIRAIEADTAGLTDELDALRERVDVIQRRTQQLGAR